jgi:CRISPR-associated protein Cas2
MSVHAPARWMVCYDITDDRRRLAVHHHLRRRGVPLQFSVFVLDETSSFGMRQLMGELRAMIHPGQDDVRAYRWPSQPECHVLGRSMLPDGLLV